VKYKFLIIFKKELDRFFKDWRMIVNALIFPGILFFLLYAFLVPLLINYFFKPSAQFTVYAINPPVAAEIIFNYGGMELVSISQCKEELIKKDITGKKEYFLLIFPDDFNDKITVYDIHSGFPAPEITIFFNSLTAGFSEYYGRLIAILEAWESGIVNKFDINRTGGGDLAETEDITRYFLAIILPMFILMLLFNGAIAVTISAITGEKERGTYAAILVTPISTRELAAGKILALGFEAFLCGVSGSLGIILSLPVLINNLDFNFLSLNAQSPGLAIDLNVYSLMDYGSLLMILFSASYLIVTIVALVSIPARTVREAQMFFLPVFMALMSLSLLSVVNNNNSFNQWYYCLIPFYNTIQVLSDIISQNYSFLQIILNIFSNMLFFIIGTEILSRLFKSEKIMYNN
jgi:sodium transport system permease protein